MQEEKIYGHIGDLITPASVLTMGAIAVTVFACELRGIETRLTDMDSKIAGCED